MPEICPLEKHYDSVIGCFWLLICFSKGVFLVAVVWLCSVLRYEDVLEGLFNFVLWRCQVYILLEEHEFWNLVEKKVTLLSDATLLAKHNKKKFKGK